MKILLFCSIVFLTSCEKKQYKVLDVTKMEFVTCVDDINQYSKATLRVEEYYGFRYTVNDTLFNGLIRLDVKENIEQITRENNIIYTIPIREISFLIDSKKKDKFLFDRKLKVSIPKKESKTKDIYLKKLKVGQITKISKKDYLIRFSQVVVG